MSWHYSSLKKYIDNAYISDVKSSSIVEGCWMLFHIGFYGLCPWATQWLDWHLSLQTHCECQLKAFTVSTVTDTNTKHMDIITKQKPTQVVRVTCAC